MINNNEKASGFNRFEELTGLLVDFANCSLIECERLTLVPDNSGNLGEAEKVREYYESRNRRSFDRSSYLASFNVIYDNDGNWIAFLVSKGLDVAIGKVYYGKDYDWKIRLIDEIVEACGIESSNDIRHHMYWDVC